MPELLEQGVEWINISGYVYLSYEDTCRDEIEDEAAVTDIEPGYLATPENNSLTHVVSRHKCHIPAQDQLDAECDSCSNNDIISLLSSHTCVLRVATGAEFPTCFCQTADFDRKATLMKLCFTYSYRLRTCATSCMNICKTCKRSFSGHSNTASEEKQICMCRLRMVPMH